MSMSDVQVFYCLMPAHLLEVSMLRLRLPLLMSFVLHGVTGTVLRLNCYRPLACCILPLIAWP